MTTPIPQTKIRANQVAGPLPPTGPAAAAIVAAGAGCTALGLAVILVEASPHHIKNWLNVYDPVGPLSGKTLVAVLVYALTWILLHLRLRHRDVRLGRWFMAGFILVGIGLLTTFPPFYQLFTVKP